MPGWSDEREREWQRSRAEADWRARERYEGREGRSFDRPDAYRADPDRPSDYDDDHPAWQDRDYEGVSPGFRQHERDYESGYRPNPRFTRQDYTRGGAGGRFYGDDGRERLYREESAGPAYAEGRRFGTREADERYARATRGYGGFSSPYGTFSGGTGGYDYERGYGDAGRGEGRRDFEGRAREAGEFVRRTGRKVASWFNDLSYGDDLGARGLGPKGYKRSDERICDEVHQRLTDDPWLDASDIDVAVANGEVTLSGKVEDREAKHRAERIVEDLSGVTHVQNNLRVRPGGAVTTAGRGYGDGVQDAHMRSEGDASMETSANATGTTSRKN